MTDEAKEMDGWAERLEYVEKRLNITGTEAILEEES